MKIFDTLSSADAQITVIDIRAGLLSTTLRALRDIGFLDAAKKDQLTFARVPHPRPVDRLARRDRRDRADFMGDAHYFLVKNFINNTTFFEWDPATYNSYFKKIKDAYDITIPKLNEMACEQVELASVPYVSFVANKGGGRPGGGLFVRAARLCPALARQRVGRVRPREAHRLMVATAAERQPRPRAPRTPGQRDGRCNGGRRSSSLPRRGRASARR